MGMKKFGGARLILFFVILTFVLTLVVIYTWEGLLMKPLYSYVESLYPGPENSDYRWRVAQRIEHFFISSTVDAIVVTALLLLVRRQQRELRESEERYRAVFEQAGDGIGVVRATNHLVVEVNKKFGDILGYQPNDLQGKHICELLESGGAESGSGTLSELMLCGPRNRGGRAPAPFPAEAEITVNSAAGSLLPLSASCSTLTTGKETFLILIIRDLTERRRLERQQDQMRAQLFQTSKLASLGELSAGVAHEINNPLSAVINFAQLLKDDGDARGETNQMMVNGIIDEGRRIAAIVTNLLTFARQDSYAASEQVEIGRVIADAMSLFGHQLKRDGISAVIDIDGGVGPILASASRLRQVIVNLISNARHALRADPRQSKILRITVRQVESQGRRHVHIEFFDNGVGIPEENIDKVFDPFFTTRRNSGGTGLGLSLSFAIIHDYGGRITVESEPGGFTRFIVELPAKAAEEAPYAEGSVGGRRA